MQSARLVQENLELRQKVAALEEEKTILNSLVVSYGNDFAREWKKNCQLGWEYGEVYEQFMLMSEWQLGLEESHRNQGDEESRLRAACMALGDRVRLWQKACEEREAQSNQYRMLYTQELATTMELRYRVNLLRFALRDVVWLFKRAYGGVAMDEIGKLHSLWNAVQETYRATRLAKR